MDCRESAVVIDDVEKLTATLVVLGREREQVKVQRAQVLVLAAQVVEFVNCGRGEIDCQHVVTAESPGFGVVAKTSARNQDRACCGTRGVLEKFRQSGRHLLEIPVILAFGIEVVPEIREVLR